MDKLEALRASLDLTKTGYTGINEQGLKVDRRHYPSATPLNFNPSLNIPPPLPVKEDKVKYYKIHQYLHIHDGVIDYAKIQTENALHELLRKVVEYSGDEFDINKCEFHELDDDKTAFIYGDLMGTIVFEILNSPSSPVNQIEWAFYPIPK